MRFASELFRGALVIGLIIDIATFVGKIPSNAGRLIGMYFFIVAMLSLVYMGKKKDMDVLVKESGKGRFCTVIILLFLCFGFQILSIFAFLKEYLSSGHL